MDLCYLLTDLCNTLFLSCPQVTSFEASIHSEAFLPYKHTCSSLFRIQSGGNVPFWKWHSQITHGKNGELWEAVHLFPGFRQNWFQTSIYQALNIPVPVSCFLGFFGFFFFFFVQPSIIVSFLSESLSSLMIPNCGTCQFSIYNRIVNGFFFF